ncbi:MAG: VWA domain-containing protein, partial [Planctomycetota bacterium]
FGAWSLRQAAARFAACLGLAAIANNDRVGLIAGSGDVERFVMPKKGAGHVLRLVRDCLVLQGGAIGTDLGALLAHASAALRRRTVVFLMSDFLALGHEHALALGARRHDLVAVRLLPREVLEPPAALLRSIDPETGRVQLVDLRSARVMAMWLRRCAAWRARADEIFGRARIDCIDIEVPAVPDIAAVSQPILRFFRRRELRAVKR